MTAFFPAGFRATNDDGFPLAGGQLRYYAATTTTPKAVYADAGLTSSLGSIVNINASGEPVTGGNVETMVYPGPGAYKVRLYDANNVLIWEQDNIPGYVAPPEESSSGLPVTPVISKTANYTVVEGDRGKLIKLDPTGGPFEITLHLPLPWAMASASASSIPARPTSSLSLQTQVSSFVARLFRQH